jgi:chaperonin GroES
MELDAKLSITKIVNSPNIAKELSEEDLAIIGNQVFADWETDSTSRADWEEKTADAMKLALQVAEEKSTPWPGAANIKFPLITIAALQYQARAYPALIPGTSVVKARVVGNDPTMQLQARANRVADYMSYQVLEEDAAWEENMDKVLIAQAIVGCVFKKTFFDPALKHNVSQHVVAKDLYIPYYSESVEKATRITQILYLSKNTFIQNERLGLYLPLETTTQPLLEMSNPLEEAKQEAQGVHPQANDSSLPRTVLEQHRYLDLDGDNYEEPYIVTIDKETKQVLRIVARFTSTGVSKNRRGAITSIAPVHYFTKFGFIPSPDGGIYDLGFGVLLGPINETINTIFNQLVDAGTLSVTAGGFLGRGVKFKSGDNSFRPFEWKRVDSTGDDLRKGIFPLPVRDPNQVLFQLLETLINYGERIGMATDPMVGISPGQNTPAETSRNTISEGQKVLGAIFKRTYRSLKEEFKKIYKLNSIYLNDKTYYFSLVSGKNAIVLASDFVGEGDEIIPAADPNMVSKEQKISQAAMLKQASDASPGMYNRYLVELKFATALGVEDLDKVLPDPNGENALPPPPPDTKVVVETMKLTQQDKEYQMDVRLKMFDLMQELEYLKAEILEKETRAALNIAQAEGIESGHQIAAIQSSVALLKQKQTSLIDTLAILKDLAGFSKEKKGLVDGITGGMDGVETPSDDAGVV